MDGPIRTQESADEDRAGQDGWRWVQLARLAADVESLARGVRELLEDFTPAELHKMGGAALAPGRRDAVLNDVCTLRDVVDQAGLIGGDFTPDGEVLSLTIEEIGAAAADVLARGSGDVATLQLAACLLSRSQGFPALAAGIEADPCGHVGRWGDATIADVLRAFHDGSRAATAWVCASARIGTDALWTSLNADALARVTWALRNAP